ncbi:hypothetical protein [Vibrio harveyi]|uniref:hypothetical protein n=1 Tax=Vibrio harveyi TaxID=669 RepID=UPI0023806E43|nr:hypothetical protein [Vibrio harveyi]
MSKLLLFIGENEQFDKDTVVQQIRKIVGVRNDKEGNFIGSAFEAEYAVNNESYIVRLSDDLETITVDGIDDNSLDFVLQLKTLLMIPLQVVDMDYSFHLELANVNSLVQLKEEIRKGV